MFSYHRRFSENIQFSAACDDDIIGVLHFYKLIRFFKKIKFFKGKYNET